MKLPTERRRVYALYGHLDDAAIVDKKTGDKIVKGQVLGRMGDIHQNGGWFIPHVHFQLSLHAPETHDMPGAVSMADRTRALIEYPDPRYILGPLTRRSRLSRQMRILLPCLETNGANEVEQFCTLKH
jgi:murein DD-endopeptidase MepM/ murein hydrolase activator NlpD